MSKSDGSVSSSSISKNSISVNKLGRGILGNQNETNAIATNFSNNTSSSNKSILTPGKSSDRQSSMTSNHSVKASQAKPRSRFSLRRLFYTNPLLSPPFARSHKKNKVRRGCDRDSGGGAGPDNQSEGSWVAGDRDDFSTASSVQGAAGGSYGGHSVDPAAIRECALCLGESPGDQFPQLRNCPHLTCVACLQQYVRIEIQEGRVNLKCPQCSEILHPNDIEMLVGEDRALIHLYESLMLRRVLAADPDTRWCPAPNCTFAVVAAGCASCPKINCEKEGCNASFCYHCKAEWHPNQTCDMARAQRMPTRSSSLSFTFSGDSGSGPAVGGPSGGSELKVCPRCSVLIVKMDDGSCNHMTCAVCGSEFCWLCMKEISDLHYLSPSG